MNEIIKLPETNLTNEQIQEHIFGLKKQSDEIIHHLQNLYTLIGNTINSSNENFEAIIKKITL